MTWTALRSAYRVHLVGEGSPPFNISLPYNPESVRISAGSEWASLGPLGLSHAIQQYSRTKSLTVEFDVKVHNFSDALQSSGALGLTRNPDDSLTRPSGAGSGQINDLHNKLLALTVPAFPGASPRIVSLVWPRMLALRGHIESADFRFIQFAKNGAPLQWEASVRFVEDRLTFRTEALARSEGFIGLGFGPRDVS